MRTVPIESLPNQQLSINVNDDRFVIRLKVATSSMIADVYCNDEAVILGQRIAVGTPIIPYDYLCAQGNFILIVDGEDLPDWQKFGVSQQLLYVSPGELIDSP